MPKVFVTQNLPRLNILPAQRYGDFVLIFPEYVNFTLEADTLCERADSILSGFTDEDYLLLVGNPVAIGVCLTYAADAANGRVRTLVWDRQERTYYVNTLRLFEKGQNDEERCEDPD